MQLDQGSNSVVGQLAIQISSVKLEWLLDRRDLVRTGQTWIATGSSRGLDRVARTIGKRRGQRLNCGRGRTAKDGFDQPSSTVRALPSAAALHLGGVAMRQAASHCPKSRTPCSLSFSVFLDWGWRTAFAFPFARRFALASPSPSTTETGRARDDNRPARRRP
ncbi:hypothetical protein NL676_021607 [Syzygium grande]|nr:hypothetical protein NL676_021607 [Syzygium grande]